MLLFEQFDQSIAVLRSGDPSRPLFVPHDHASRESFAVVQREWDVLKAAWRAPTSPGAERTALQAEAFVIRIDAFVSAIERHLSRLTSILNAAQFVMVALTIASAIALLYSAYLFIFNPLTRLQAGLARVEKGDLAARVARAPYAGEFRRVFGDDIFKEKSSASDSQPRGICKCLKKYQTVPIGKAAHDSSSDWKKTHPDSPGDFSHNPAGPMKYDAAETLDRKVIKDLRDQAYKVIEKSLDIVTIVREVNNLKALTHLMFKDYQLKVLPLISLSLQYKLHQKKLEMKKARKANTELEEQISRVGTLGFNAISPRKGSVSVAGKVTFTQALTQVHDSSLVANTVKAKERTFEQKVPPAKTFEADVNIQK